MTVVIDASALVAALVDSGPEGRWAEQLLTADLVAPHLLPAEVASVLRRAARAGDIADEVAGMAHAELAELRVTYVPYEAVADRIWELRHNLTPYDAWYVAVAELTGAALATLDRRLATAAGPTCRFLTPEPPPPARRAVRRRATPR